MTRNSNGTADIEVVVAIEGVLGKVLANSGQRAQQRAEPFVPCEAWRAGLPPVQTAATGDATATLNATPPSYDNDPLVEELLNLPRSSATTEDDEGSAESDEDEPGEPAAPYEPFDWDKA